MGPQSEKKVEKERVAASLPQSEKNVEKERVAASFCAILHSWSSCYFQRNGSFSGI